jgi:dGTPase
VQRFLGAGQPLLEAQVVDAADSLAYDTHDIDDALSARLLAVADLTEVPFWNQAVERVRRQHADVGPLQLQPAVVRRLIDWQVTDMLEHTRQRIRQESIRTVADVRGAAGRLVGPGTEVRALKTELEAFLHRRVYRHPRVLRMASKGARILHSLFQEFCRAPELLPDRYAARIERAERIQIVVCDYLAGMTDRYAQDEFLKLFQPDTDV